VSLGSFSSAGILTMARGSNGDLYGVNGLERGFRWDGKSAAVEQLGISPPAAAPTVTSTTGTPAYYLEGIDVRDGGFGYIKEPPVTISGSGGAKAKAEVAGGGVSRVIMQTYGSGYTAPPTVTISAPDAGGEGGTGATFTATVESLIAGVQVTNGGSGYTEAPTVSLTYSPSVTVPAILEARIDNGRVVSVQIRSEGDPCTGTVTITLSGGDGFGATAQAVLRHRIASVSVTAGGTGYFGRPPLKAVGASDLGFVAQAVVNESTGAVSSVNVLSGGTFSVKPTGVAIDSDYYEQPATARIRPVLRAGITGKYWCAYRYVDDTPESEGGPIPSSISPFAEVELTAPVQTLNWSALAAGSEARAHKIELWRTTSDQALVLYRVATLDPATTTYTDSMSDSELARPSRTGFKALPVVLPNGQPNARRFRIPPQNKSSVVMFQDRAWYGVDVAGRKYDGTTSSTHAEPNTLYFSEVDEPESVPEPNELVLQDNVNGNDRITALMPFGGGMVVFQERHCYRLTYAAQPVIDANFALLAQRGCLNQRCWATHDGVAYVADSMGIYVLGGARATPLSDGIDTYWTRNLIHFASAANFFLEVDPVTRVMRFFFSVTAGLPDRALCYHPITQAWWEEQYAQRFGAAEVAKSGGRQRLVLGAQSGSLLLADAGGSDISPAGAATGIACQFRGSNFPLTNEPDRSLRILYSPTTAACNLSLLLHYNNSSSPRAAAVATNRGTGFTTDGGGHATLDLSATRSSLGDATGYAVAMYAGRQDDRSSGGDRHVAVAIAATKPASETVTIHGIAMQGVAQ
jgi:hypothetical protein